MSLQSSIMQQGQHRDDATRTEVINYVSDSFGNSSFKGISRFNKFK